MAKQVLYPCVAHVLYKNVRKFEFLCIVNCKTSAIKNVLSWFKILGTQRKYTTYSNKPSEIYQIFLSGLSLSPFFRRPSDRNFFLLHFLTSFSNPGDSFQPNLSQITLKKRDFKIDKIKTRPSSDGDNLKKGLISFINLFKKQFARIAVTCQKHLHVV